MTDSTTAYAQTPAEVSPVSLAGWRDYVILMKPRVMSLVVFTGFTGLVMAPGDLHPVLAFTALLCIAVGAGASGALNMWYDSDVDSIMLRTRTRPLPRGAMHREDALAFGMFLSGASILTLGLVISWVAAVLLALTIAYYVVFYTMWLKRRTPQNIVIGGAAGALPPVIGWAAVTGTVALEPVILFLIIFMWTPPHFWALSLYRAGDYEKAGIPMLPVTHGPAATRTQILVYTLALVPVSLLPSLMGFAGHVYLATAGGLGLVFIVFAALLWQRGRAAADPQAETGVKHLARRTFSFSTLYLFALFLVLAAERLIGLPMMAPVVSL